MKNLFILPFPYYYHETTLDRLPSILKYGLISKNEADRLGIENYKQNFNSSWNDDYVSVANDSAREVAAPEISLLIEPKGLTTIKPSANNGDINRPIDSELLIKDKIPPKNFVGIVIGEVGYDYKLEKEVKPNPLKVEAILQYLKQSHVDFSLPIYFKGERVWSKKG